MYGERLRFETRVALDIAYARVRRMGRGPHAPAPVILNSLPKSGTHLATKLLEGLPGMTRVRLPLRGLTADLLAPRGAEEIVQMGVASPKPVSLAKVGQWLRRVPAGAFVIAHVPHSDAFANLLRHLEYRMILLLRDPRDVAVSSAAYLASSRRHELHDIFRALDQPQRLLASINGVDEGNARLLDLRSRFHSMSAWRDEAFTTTVRFEDLVGPAGGGNAEAQRHAVSAIARHLGLQIDIAEVRRLSDALFGGTPTFRRGRIGGWEEEFGATHREAAGPLVGDLLCDLGYEENDAWWRGSGKAPHPR